MRVKPGVRRQPGLHVDVFVGGVVVQDHMHGKPFRDLPVDGAGNLRNSSCRCRGRHDPMTCSVSTFSAANNVCRAACCHACLRWPGTIGSDGCVRSNAYTEDFSSMQSTTALSGVAGRIIHSTK